MSRRLNYALEASLIISLVFHLGGCARKHAVVHIVTKDVDTQSSVSVKLFSAKDGQYLGDSPLVLRRYKPVHTSTLSLIVKEEGYPLYWEIFKVSNWARNKRDAADAAYRNDILFMIKKDSVKGKN